MPKKSIFLTFLSLFFVFNLNASEMYQSVKPEDATLVKKDSSKNFCNVCGMHLTKFYKTNHVTEFKNGHKEQYCSIHCQAKIDTKFSDKIKLVKVVDAKTLKLIDAKTAHYVVGSNKKGTMSAISKYAFKNIEDAKEFQKNFGGDIYNYTKSLEKAKIDFEKDDKLITKKE